MIMRMITITRRIMMIEIKNDIDDNGEINGNKIMITVMRIIVILIGNMRIRNILTLKY